MEAHRYTIFLVNWCFILENFLVNKQSEAIYIASWLAINILSDYEPGHSQQINHYMASDPTYFTDTTSHSYLPGVPSHSQLVLLPFH